MIRVIYTSGAPHQLGASDLSEILNTARSNNERDDITGMLIYHRSRFLQVLEGPETEVMACVARIEADPRHHNVRTLSRQPVTERVCSRWRMGIADVAQLEPDVVDSVFDMTKIVDVTARGAVPDKDLERLLRNFLLSVGATQHAFAGKQ